MFQDFYALVKKSKISIRSIGVAENVPVLAVAYNPRRVAVAITTVGSNKFNISPLADMDLNAYFRFTAVPTMIFLNIFEHGALAQCDLYVWTDAGVPVLITETILPE